MLMQVNEDGRASEALAADAPVSVRTFVNPVITGAPGEDHGDPFVIKYLDDFYLYHSGETAGRRGISVHRSQDLVHWEFAGYALEAAESGWAYSDLWAPEVVYERGTFYMYVSATSRRRNGRGPWDAGDGDDAGRRIGVARATSPLGPFVLDDEPLSETWSIDAHPFRDDDGTFWLFYSVRTDETRRRGADGTGTVVDRLISPDRLEGRPTRVTFPSQRWEGPYGDWYWNEAPYVLKRRGTYFQLYSGGFFNDASYAVGIATAPSPRGPWRKYRRNPILRGRGPIRGPGHNSIVFGPDAATPYAVYHGYLGDEPGRKIHIDRLRWAGDRPAIAGPTAGEQPLPPTAHFDPAVPHWRAEAWARGTWVGVAGSRFELSPDDVWHQVEAIRSGGRVSVRIGGVLRSSRPQSGGAGEPAFTSDGRVGVQTITSFLEDGDVHVLPAGGTYSWEWGASAPIELSLAVKGDGMLEVGDTVHEFESDGYGLVQVGLEPAGEEILVRAGPSGATVTDLFVHAPG